MQIWTRMGGDRGKIWDEVEGIAIVTKVKLDREEREEYACEGKARMTERRNGG